MREEAEALLEERTRRLGETDSLVALRRMIGPLGRMEDYLRGEIAAEEFVVGFSREWGHLRIGRRYGPGVEQLRSGLSQFYELIHFYSPYADRRSEEPLLFDKKQLRRHTREAFDRLKAQWFDEARLT
jgi:hypothetical protein